MKRVESATTAARAPTPPATPGSSYTPSSGRGTATPPPGAPGDPMFLSIPQLCILVNNESLVPGGANQGKNINACASATRKAAIAEAWSNGMAIPEKQTPFLLSPAKKEYGDALTFGRTWMSAARKCLTASNGSKRALRFFEKTLDPILQDDAKPPSFDDVLGNITWEACKWGAPPPAFIAAKPDLYCIQGQTRFAVFSDVFSSDLNLPRNNAGILSGVPFTSGAGQDAVLRRVFDAKGSIPFLAANLYDFVSHTHARQLRHSLHVLESNKRPGAHSAIGVLSPIIRQTFYPGGALCSEDQMNDILGPNWRQALSPKAAKGCVDEKRMSTLQKDAKATQMRLKRYVEAYLWSHVFGDGVRELSAPSTGLRYFVCLVYSLSLRDQGWPLVEVVTRRLRDEEERGRQAKSSITNLGAWGSLFSLDRRSQTDPLLQKIILKMGVGSASAKRARELKPLQIMADMATSFLLGDHRGSMHDDEGLAKAVKKAKEACTNDADSRATSDNVKFVAVCRSLISSESAIAINSLLPVRGDATVALLERAYWGVFAGVLGTINTTRLQPLQGRMTTESRRLSNKSCFDMGLGKQPHLSTSSAPYSFSPLVIFEYLGRPPAESPDAAKMRKNALLFVLLALQHAHHKVQRVEEVSDDFKLIVAELTDCPFTRLLVSDDDKHRLGGPGFFLFDFERHYIKSAVRFGSAADLSTRSRQDIIANNSDGKGDRSVPVRFTFAGDDGGTGSVSLDLPPSAVELLRGLRGASRIFTPEIHLPSTLAETRGDDATGARLKKRRKKNAVNPETGQQTKNAEAGEDQMLGDADAGGGVPRLNSACIPSRDSSEGHNAVSRHARMTKRSSSSKTAFNGIGGEQNPADSDGTRVHRQEASDGESGKRKRSESSRERKREKGDEAAHKDTRKRKERPALEENEKGAAEPCRGGSQASVTPTTLRSGKGRTRRSRPLAEVDSGKLEMPGASGAGASKRTRRSLIHKSREDKTGSSASTAKERFSSGGDPGRTGQSSGMKDYRTKEDSSCGDKNDSTHAVSKSSSGGSKVTTRSSSTRDNTSSLLEVIISDEEPSDDCDEGRCPASTSSPGERKSAAVSSSSGDNSNLEEAISSDEDPTYDGNGTRCPTPKSRSGGDGSAKAGCDSEGGCSEEESARRDSSLNDCGDSTSTLARSTDVSTGAVFEATQQQFVDGVGRLKARVRVKVE